MLRHEEPDAVFVRWVDSANLFQDRWANMDDLENFAEETFCTTLGWLVAETDHSLFIASSIAPEEVGSVMQIPKCAVKQRSVVWGLLGEPDAPSLHTV